MKIITNNSDETINLGIKLGTIIKNNNVVILLDGDLAAGKTTFTKGIAKGLGINSIIKSPTFTIMREYSSLESKLYHLDLYRLDEVGTDFDLEEYIDDLNSVVVIEWPYKVTALLPKEYIKIYINRLGDEVRSLDITSTPKYSEVINKL